MYNIPDTIRELRKSKVRKVLKQTVIKILMVVNKDWSKSTLVDAMASTYASMRRGVSHAALLVPIYPPTKLGPSGRRN